MQEKLATNLKNMMKRDPNWDIKKSLATTLRGKLNKVQAQDQDMVVDYD